MVYHIVTHIACFIVISNLKIFWSIAMAELNWPILDWPERLVFRLECLPTKLSLYIIDRPKFFLGRNIIQQQLVRSTCETSVSAHIFYYFRRLVTWMHLCWNDDTETTTTWWLRNWSGDYLIIWGCFHNVLSCIKYFNFSVHQRKVTGMVTHLYPTTRHAFRNGKRKI